VVASFVRIFAELFRRSQAVDAEVEVMVSVNESAMDEAGIGLQLEGIG
jgi:hypothetical protein